MDVARWLCRRDGKLSKDETFLFFAFVSFLVSKYERNIFSVLRSGAPCVAADCLSASVSVCRALGGA